MSGRELRTLTIGSAAVALSALLLTSICPAPAAAEPGLLGWLPWRQNRADWRRSDDGAYYAQQQYNRSATQQWELNPPLDAPTLSPANIAPLKAAIKRYSDIVAQGGWPEMPAVQLGQGNRGEPVAILRQRLEVTGDLPPSGGRYSGYYDGYLVEAMKRFQYRHGLTPTGAVDQPTLMALNVPASSRLRQLRTNLVRLTSSAKATAKRYVVVNIPAAQVEAVENDRVVSRHSAVVGKLDRQTPVLRSNIYEINFNPYWTVPRSIIIRDLVPKARQLARRGENVLDAYKMEAFDGNGRKLDPEGINWFSDAVYKYTYRQVPWEENSLGFVKINFHNQYSVYMHDTPMQRLFGQNWRAESSGCVRVQNVQALVAWLLQGNPGWDVNRVAAMEQTGERLDVTLKQQTPVYFTYVTAWAAPDGTVHFRRDLYRQDGVDQLASAY